MCDHDDGFDGIDWMEIAWAGLLAEQMAEEERERQLLLKNLEPEEEGQEDSE